MKIVLTTAAYLQSHNGRVFSVFFSHHFFFFANKIHVEGREGGGATPRRSSDATFAAGSILRLNSLSLTS